MLLLVFTDYERGDNMTIVLGMPVFLHICILYYWDTFVTYGLICGIILPSNC